LLNVLVRKNDLTDAEEIIGTISSEPEGNCNGKRLVVGYLVASLTGYLVTILFGSKSGISGRTTIEISELSLTLHLIKSTKIQTQTTGSQVRRRSRGFARGGSQFTAGDT
jgi:uncharacterized oligopeptide transporter (OPT) family protein